MAERLSRNLLKCLSGVAALTLFAGCTAVGQGTGLDYAPSTFQDEGGVSSSVSTTLPGQYLAGRQALRERDTQSATDFFGAAYSLNGQDDFILQNTFRAALSNGDTKRALILANEIVDRKSKNDNKARLVLGIDAIGKNRFEEATAHIGEIKPTRYDLLLKPVLTAWALVGQGKLTEATEALEALDKYDGFKLLKSYHLALIAHVSGQTDLAREQYKLALRGPSGRAVRLVQSYGTFLLEQGDTEGARLIFENYKKRFPLSPTINRLLQKMDNGEAIAPLIRSPIEGAAEALYSSAAIIGQEKATSPAVTFAYFSLMLRPDLTVANILLAEIAEDRGQLAKALAYYGEVPEQSPYYLNSKIRMAWLTYKLGDEAGAFTTLNKLTKDNPTEVEPIIVLADLNRDRKDWKNAAAAYGRAIDNIGSVKARLWSLLYARGIAYERLNEWVLAEADLLKALSLKPNHPQILNYLGYSWADRGEKLEKAKELLIKAVSLRPSDGYIVDSLGWLYYRVKDFDNAAMQLEKAVALQPEDPTINDHLGDAYWQVGRQDEARYQWQRALWLEPEADQIPAIQQKIQEGLISQPAASK